MKYIIDTDKPLAEVKRGRHPKYPFNAMNIGDSFEIDPNIYMTVAMAAYQHGRRYNKRFSVKKDNDGSICCWRTE